MFKRPEPKPRGVNGDGKSKEDPLVVEGKMEYTDSRVEEKPTLAEEAESRGMTYVNSWEDIRLYDMRYFEKEIREIFNLGDNEDVMQALVKKVKEGFSFGLGVIAKHYGLSPDATFKEIQVKKTQAEKLEKEGQK